MRRAGFYKIAFGIESADEEVQRLTRKKVDLAKVEECARTAKRLGFVVYGFFIIGLPGETEAAFRKTLDYARRIELDVGNFCMAIPFVGTELYRQIESEGRFLVDTRRNIDVGYFGGRVYFEHGDVTAGDMLRRYKTAYREFYTLRRMLRLLLTVRSWGELTWLLDAGWSVILGMARRGGAAK